jgi:Flp pilus assembly CpaE family ATPase
VIMDFTGQMQVPQQALQKFLGHPITGLFSVSPGDMTKAVNKGRPLLHLFPNGAGAQALLALAKQFVKA